MGPVRSCGRGAWPMGAAESDVTGFWAVHRQDDNGSRFVVRTGLGREEAMRLAADPPHSARQAGSATHHAGGRRRSKVRGVRLDSGCGATEYGADGPGRRSSSVSGFWIRAWGQPEPALRGTGRLNRSAQWRSLIQGGLSIPAAHAEFGSLRREHPLRTLTRCAWSRAERVGSIQFAPHCSPK